MIKYYILIGMCLILTSCINIDPKEKRQFHNSNATFTINECMNCHSCILKENSTE